MIVSEAAQECLDDCEQEGHDPEQLLNGERMPGAQILLVDMKALGEKGAIASPAEANHPTVWGRA